ncbi:MAG: coiled coil domain-containing protein [Nitrospina sp.]|nr:coiled coil domain-containing protein [Nitrospina sp.]
MSLKEEYQRKLEAKIDEWSAELEVLKAKANSAQADARIKYQQELQELNSRLNELRQKRDRLKTSGEDAWEDIKAGVDKAWDSLSEGLKSAASRFK